MVAYVNDLFQLHNDPKHASKLVKDWWLKNK